MATLEELQELMNQGASGYGKPWSQMLPGNAPDVQPQFPSEGLMMPEQEMPAPVGGSGGGIDPQARAIFNRLLSKQNEGIEGQKGYMKNLKDYRDREANRALDPNFSALMMASDAWGGTKFLPSYKEPMDAAGKSDRVANADMAVQKALGGITDDEINLLKTQFYGLQSLKAGGKSDKEDQADRVDFSKSEEAKKLRSLREMGNAVREYQTLVQGSDGYEVTGEQRKKLEAAYGDLKIKYKEAAKLGALTGPDVKLLEEVIAPATGAWSAIKGETFTGGTEGVLGGIEQIKKNMKKDAEIHKGILQKVYPSTYNQLAPAYDLRESDYTPANQKKAGGLSAAEKAELDALEQKYGGR